MTAVIYARYSSDNQREESIEGQIRECTAYAEKNGITIVKHYIDRAISAKTDNRPEFQQMIKDSDKKLFDIVLEMCIRDRVPFVYIWKILRDVLNAAPDYAQAVNIPHYGWMAVLFAVLAYLIYIAALMCSHLSAFRVATRCV